MTITIANRLNGPADTTVSDATLADSAETGTVTATSPGARAVYDTANQVFDLNTVRIYSGYHRGDSAWLHAALPTSPWSARWYTWLPNMQAAGHGTSEVRIIARFGSGSGDRALVARESSGGSVQMRLVYTDLAAGITAPSSAGGGALTLDQMVRLELVYDGTDLIVRGFAGHDEPADPTEWTFAGETVTTGVLDVGGFRYRNRPTLRLGDQGQAVTDLQNELLDLGYDLGEWGADGDYGQVTADAVSDMQTDYGLSPIDGEAGPETRAAMDLALGRIRPPLYVSHLAVADDGAWIGPASAPEPEISPRLVLGTPI